MPDHEQLRQEILKKVDRVLNPDHDPQERRQVVIDRIRFMELSEDEKEEYRIQGLDPEADPEENKANRNIFLNALIELTREYSEAGVGFLLKELNLANEE